MLLCRKLGNGDEIEVRKHFRKRFAYKTLLNLRTRGDSCVRIERGSSCTWIEREGAQPQTQVQTAADVGSSCVHREEAAVSTGRKPLLCPKRVSSFVHREEAAVITKEVAVVMLCI
jgi:hypothetical protein